MRSARGENNSLWRRYLPRERILDLCKAHNIQQIALSFLEVARVPPAEAAHARSKLKQFCFAECARGCGRGLDEQRRRGATNGPTHMSPSEIQNMEQRLERS